MTKQSNKQIISKNFSEYELLDLGHGYKLERFGDKVCLRPEIKYSGSAAGSLAQLKIKADLIFEEEAKGKGKWLGKNTENLEWILKEVVAGKEIKFLLKPSAFKHVGIFPEQKANWEYIADKVSNCYIQPKVLNLFAYTGGASLVAQKFGAQVTHVDSSKSVINWARKNMELNHLSDIRWCLEDAMLFVQREAKRGNIYQGIIMDPPSFGIAKNKSRWRIEDAIVPLMENAVKLLDPRGYFLVLNTYSPQIDALMLLKALKLPIKQALVDNAKLCLQSETGKILETGELIRFSNY